MELIKTRCAICDSADDFDVVYKSNFQAEHLNATVFSARRMPDVVHYQIVRCKNDGLIRSNPVNDSDVFAGLYKKSKMNYEFEVPYLTVAYLEALDRVLPRLSRDARILEVGCGNGFMLKALIDRGFTCVRGVEPSEDAVQKADPFLKGAIVTDVLKEGVFPPGSFDFIYCFQTLDHIPDPGGFLKICHDLLSPGGFILALNHDIESFSSKLLGERSPVIDVEHTFLFSRETIRMLFVRAGFMPLETYSPINTLSLRHFFWLMPFIPRTLKSKLLNSKRNLINALLNRTIRIKLGNLCIIAQKPL